MYFTPSRLTVDHTGNIAFFNKDNDFKGKIYGTHETLSITKKLVEDSVYLSNKNIEYLKSKGKKVKTLYTEEQMHQAFDCMEAIKVNEKVKIDDNLTIMLYNNSHVLGATSISLWIRKPNNSVKHILYTSDMGSKINFKEMHFLKEMNLPTKCNLLISEATYNDPSRQYTRQDVIDERRELKKFIESELKQQRRILIPTFSYGRTQELICMLTEWFGNEPWFEKYPIFVDGVLSNKICDLYSDLLEGEELATWQKAINCKRVKRNRDYKGTLSFLSKFTPSISIVSSGFLTGGRVLTYLDTFLSNSNSTIVFTGYSGGEGSLGANVIDENVKIVKYDKMTAIKRCKVKVCKTFSSHITFKELLDLFVNMNCDKIIVHHTDTKNKDEFIQTAKDYMREKNKSTPIVATSECCNQFVL